MTTQTILTEVIQGYRAVLRDRYEFERIRHRYQLPRSLDAKKTALIRNYFLNQVYPPPEKREVLNEAFESLDSYIKHPEKLLRLLIDSGKLIFRYGRHLPKILRAGLQAMRSFRTANRFEQQLVEQAIKMELRPPYDYEKIRTLIVALPRKDLDHFVDSCQSLFETLHDRTLVKKVLEIVDYLIEQMQQHPEVYSKEEVRGLEVGRELIREGDQLFEAFPAEDRQAIFDLIFSLERDGLKDFFE